MKSAGRVTNARATLWLALEAGPRWVRRAEISVSASAADSAQAESIPNALPSTPISIQHEKPAGSPPVCQAGPRVCQGVGPLKAPWMWIVEREESPDNDDFDPFSGVSGKLLDNLLFALGLARDRDVYVASIPGGVAAPEVAPSCCRTSLRLAIDRVQPRLVLALGNSAATALHESALSRGTVQSVALGDQAVTVMVTHGLKELLSDARVKAETWADLCRARQALGAS